MKTPFVDPVGITRHGTTPRRLPRAARVAALVLAVLFAATVVSTGVASFGAYCLTSDGGDTRELPRAR